MEPDGNGWNDPPANLPPTKKSTQLYRRPLDPSIPLNTYSYNQPSYQQQSQQPAYQQQPQQPSYQQQQQPPMVGQNPYGRNEEPQLYQANKNPSYQQQPQQPVYQQQQQPIGGQNLYGRSEEPRPYQANNDPRNFGHFAQPNPNLQMKHEIDKQGQKDLHGDMNPPDFNLPQPFQRGPGGGRGGGSSGYGGIGQVSNGWMNMF